MVVLRTESNYWITCLLERVVGLLATRHNSGVGFFLYCVTFVACWERGLILRRKSELTPVPKHQIYKGDIGTKWKWLFGFSALRLDFRKEKGIFCYSQSDVGRTTSYSIGNRCSFLVDKRQGLKAGQSLPSSAEFKNVWRYLPLPHMLSCCGAQLNTEVLTVLLEDITSRTRKFLKFSYDMIYCIC